MKALIIHSFLITTLLSLVGCGSKENSVRLEVTGSFAMTSAGYSGGLVVSGKNSIGQRFVRTVFGGTTLNVVLPDGSWDLSVVGWDGAAPSATVSPFSGVAYCGRKIINLASSDTSANVVVSKANCLNADFSGSPFVNTGAQVIHPLKIVTCGSFYQDATDATKITAANSTSYTSNFCNNTAHPADLRSRTKSIKIIPLHKTFDAPYTILAGANPYCLKTSSGNEGIFHLSQQIPVLGLPIQIALYEDSNCMNEKSFVLFPDGLKNGYAPKFDSILDNKTADTNPAASTANRLFISDNGLNRGWSPFYALMPDMKCSGAQCGAIAEGTMANTKYFDGVFDYFLDVDYQGELNEAKSIRILSDSNICSSVTAPAYISEGSAVPNFLTLTGCSYSVSNGQGMIDVQVKSTINASSCPGELSDICRSPSQKFVLNVNGTIKEIYFNGKKAYPGFVPVEFSHTFVDVRRQLSAITTCSLYAVLNVPPTGSNTLKPITGCRVASEASTPGPVMLAKPFYDTGSKTFFVDESGSQHGEVSFLDGTSSSTKLIMLPPSAREQKDFLSALFESIGGTSIKETFQYEAGNNYDDNEGKEYGSLRKVRDFFSPDGPSGLFDHTSSCANVVGTKSITFSKKDVTETYEITIQNIDASASTDLNHIHPNGYSVDTALTGTATADTVNNFGKFQKSMVVKQNGVVKEVILFDCGSKRGRLEARHADFRDNKYRREKQLVYWNTTSTNFARFESYSRSMESNNNTFTPVISDERKFEKFYKINGDSNRIGGRIYKLSSYLDSWNNSVSKNLQATRFEIYKPSLTWKYIYAFYNFRVPNAVDLIPGTGEYSELKVATFGSPHFCGNELTFPMVNLSNCSAMPFTATEHGTVKSSFGTYQSIHGANFDPIMNSGYLPVSW